MRPALRLICSIAILAILLLTSVSAVHADSFGPTDASSSGQPIGLNNIDPFLNTENTMVDVTAGLMDMLVGNGNNTMGESLAMVQSGPNSKPVAYVFQHSSNGGALGTLAMLTGSMYSNPPTSTVTYLASIGSGLGITSPAYAADASTCTGVNTIVCGSGAGVIEPILSLWQFTRNIAYLIYIVIFVGVGFMIMFRQKINPQTVISVQAALPGLIIGLILITFSYFIAALIIDLSFVGVQLIAQPFISAGNNALGDVGSLASDPNLLNLFGSARTAASGTGGDIQSVISSLNIGGGGLGVQTLITALGGLAAGCFSGLVAGVGGCVVGGAIGGAAGAAAPKIISLLIPAILSLALVIQFLRLFLKLVEAYISLLVDTITGPLVIMAGSLPGRGKSISNWWKSLLANSLVFPTVFGAILFAGLILGITDPNAWLHTPPLFGGFQPAIIRVILSFGILLALPTIPDTVKGAFGIKGLPGGQAAISGFMAGLGVGRAGFNTLTGNLQAERKQYIDQAIKHRVHPATPAPSKPKPYEFWKFGTPRV